MKKKATVLVTLVLVMALALSGCGSKEAPREYDFDLSEYVTVGEYKGLEYTAFDVEVTDEEIQAEIDAVLQDNADQVELTEGTAQKGNFIQMTYDMEVDGETVEGISSEGFMIEVGAGTMLEDVDKALVGKAVGETFTVETVFPDDYEIDPTLAGKGVTFEITINKIFEIIYPELDDAFAMKVLGFDTVDDYKENLFTALYETELTNARYAAGEEIWAQILENSEVLQYPQEKVDETYTLLTDNFTALYEQYGMTMEDALTAMEMTQEEYEASMRESAEGAVKEEMILYTIARENDLELTAEDKQTYVDSLLSANEMTEEDFEKTYSMSIEQYLDESGIMISLLYENVFYFLVDNGVAK